MSTDLSGLREQIIANAKYMMCSTVQQTVPAVKQDTPTDSPTDTPLDTPADAEGSKLPTLTSVATLVAPVTPGNPAATGPSTSRAENLDVIVFGETEFTAAVMCGIYPVIEGASAAAPEGAMRKLLLATSELLDTIMPKLGGHQRNIHGGGVVNEDFLSRDLLDKKV